MESAFHRNGLLWGVPLLLLLSVAFARGAFAEKAHRKNTALALKPC